MTAMQSLLAPSIFLSMCCAICAVILNGRGQKAAAYACAVPYVTFATIAGKLSGILIVSWLWILSPAWIAVFAYVAWVFYHLAIWAWNTKA